MENAADALKMAAAVLIFVLALSISINAFGEVRKTSQVLLDYQDREYDYTYVEENGSTERIVGLETMIPTIYKLYKENYKIIFESRTIAVNGVYKKINADSSSTKINYIDLEKEVFATDKRKEEFIMAILYGANTDTKTTFRTVSRIDLNDRGLYDIIKGKRFKEKLGVYYQEEVQGESGGESNTPDSNKTKKRVITYEEI